MPKKFFTDEQKNFYEKKFFGKSDREMAEILNNRYNEKKFSSEKLRQYRFRNKLSNGRTGKFSIGNVPYNKGTKGVVKKNKGSFKKGQTSPRAIPVGTIIFRNGVYKKKISKGYNYKPVARIVWEEHYKEELTEEDIIIHLDGDKKNFSIDNLEKISLADLAQLNRLGILELGNKSLTKSMIALSRLRKKINDKEK